MVRPARTARAKGATVLYGVTAGGAALEAVGLKAAGMTGALGLAPQATALPALAALHDDRWILVYGTSWPTVAAEALASTALRAVLLAVVVRTAWPDARPPGWGRLLARGGVASGVCLLAMSPWATLSFVGGVVSLSFPILATVVGASVSAVAVLAHAGVAARWWAAWPPARAMGVTALSVGLTTLAAVGVAASPGWLCVGAAAAGGAANGWCWRRVVGASARAAPRRLRPSSAVAPVAMTAVLALCVAVAVVGLGSFLERAIPHRRYQEALPQPGQQAVVLVGGFQSDWNGARPALRLPGFYVTEFSYRGLAPSGRPLAYESRFTEEALPVLAARMARQFALLHRRTHRRLDVLAVSEGTLVLRQYLSGHPDAPLGVVVLDSPLLRPDAVSYPTGASGWGLAGGWEAGLLARLVDAENRKADVGPRIPLLRSLLREAPLFRQRSLCPMAGIRMVALLPLSAAVADPPGPIGGVPDEVVPAMHAGLGSLGSTRRLAEALFRGGHLGREDAAWGVAFQLTRDASAAWEAPALPLEDAAPRGTGLVRTDPAPGAYGCPAKDAPSARAS